MHRGIKEEDFGLGGYDTYDTVELSENLTQFQKDALPFLENLGFFEIKNGHRVVDLDKIKKTSQAVLYSELHDAGLAEKYEDELEDGTVARFFMKAFDGVKVVSREDFIDHDKKDELGGKDLIYNPKNKEDAFDIDAIKQADFYFLSPELDRPNRRRNRVAEDAVYSDKVNADADEVNLALLIYHPKFGNGERKDNGSLFVTYKARVYENDPKTGKKRSHYETRKKRMSMDFQHHFQSLIPSLSPQKIRSSRKFMEEGGVPHLQEKGLLLPSDFRYGTTQKIREAQTEINEPVTKDGYVSIRGVRYFVGRKYGKEGKYSVVEVGNGKAVVATNNPDNSDRIVASFDLLDPTEDELNAAQEDFERRRHERGKKGANNKSSDLPVTYSQSPTQTKGILFARKDKINFVEYKEGESPFHLPGSEQKVAVGLHEVGEMNKLKRNIAKETSIDFDKLSLREQATFLDFYSKIDSYGKSALLGFLDIHGENGAKAFLAMRYDETAFANIMMIGQEFGRRGAAEIFAKFTTLTDKIDTLDDLLRSKLKPDAAEQIDHGKLTQELMKKAAGLLDRFADLSRNGQADPGELEEQLKKIDSNVEIQRSIYTTAFKGNAKADLRDVQGAVYEKLDVSEISPTDKDKMKQVAQANWASRGKAGQAVLQQFYDLLDSGKGSEFYMWKVDGEIVAFIRFEEGHSADAERYFGSFNVNPNKRGHAFGEAVMVRELKAETDAHSVEATVHPGISVGTDYVEKRGFVITHLTKEKHPKVKLPTNSNENTFFRILADKKFNSLKTKKWTVDELKEVAGEQERAGLKELEEYDVIVLKFNATDKKSYNDILNATERLCSLGYIGSRYFHEKEDPNQRYIVFEYPEEKQLDEIQERIKNS